MYGQLALADTRALKGSSQLLLQPIGARAERPCSNERPSALALELCETAEEASLRLMAEFRLRTHKTRTPRNEISQKRTDCEPHRCPFASKRLCGSYAAPSNVSATTAAALRTDGAAPLSIPCCAAARSAMLQRAAPRARGPRAAHHEPGAREPESVAASVQFSRRPRRALDAIAQSMPSHRWRTKTSRRWREDITRA